MFSSPVKSVVVSIGLGTLTIVGYYIYDAYRRSIKPSKYMLIAQKMGFIGYDNINGQRIRMEKQQEAVLRIFQLAGYFTLPNIWRDLNSIGGIENVEEVYKEMSAVIKYSNADQPDPTKFNAKYLRKNLFKSDNIDLQDALDLILYIGQYAFARDVGQERYELVSYEWMSNYPDEFRQAARLLRLIDREYPSLNEYDGGWIAGASRVALSQRIIDYNNCIVSRNIKICGETFVLAGEREMWANIDGMSPTTSEKLLEASRNNIDIDTISLLPHTDDDLSHINEGKSYMMKLAQSYNIKLHLSEPFIQYKSKDECPPDRFPNRIYANYDTSESSKLTETLMSRDLWKTFSNNNTSKLCIIDTSAKEESRPDTASTARDAAERLVKGILAGDYGEKKTFVILFCTNNPFIERQALATQRQVNQVLQKYGLAEKSYQIKIEGVGCSYRQQYLTIAHSEFGALLAEKWRVAVADINKSLGLHPKRDMKNLLFQTRDKNNIVSDPPKIRTNRFRNFFKTWFDLYLI
jgi:hypothetical protein